MAQSVGEKEGEQALLIREVLILGNDYAELRVYMPLKIVLLLLHGQWLTRLLVSAVRQLLSLSSVITVL